MGPDVLNTRMASSVSVRQATKERTAMVSPSFNAAMNALSVPVCIVLDQDNKCPFPNVHEPLISLAC